MSNWRPSRKAMDRGMEAFAAARDETEWPTVRDVMPHLNRSREYTADLMRALVRAGRLVASRDDDEPGSPFIYSEPE